MYMAPEVLIGSPYNEKIDVFSFGIILYELFAGVLIASRVLFDEGLGEGAEAGEDAAARDARMQAYAERVAAGHREPLPRHWPPELKLLVSKCWAQDPADRPSFREVVKALYLMKQSGVVEQLDEVGPKVGYDPVSDCGCGCSIM
jgi:serine/threonine protein kinase